MTFTIQCPNCSIALGGNPQFIGKKVACTRCKHVFIVPSCQGDALTATQPEVPAIQQANEPSKATSSRPSIRAIAAVSICCVLVLFAVIAVIAVFRAINSPARDVALGNQNENGTVRRSTQSGSKGVWGEEKSNVGAILPKSSSVTRVEHWEQLAIAANENHNDLLVNFSTDQNGVRKLRFTTSKMNAPIISIETQEYDIPVGIGIDLANSFDWKEAPWRWQAQTVDAPTLVENTMEGNGIRVTKLRPFGTPLSNEINTKMESVSDQFAISEHKHLWSPDGKTLFVLAGNPDYGLHGPRHLLKVDAVSWTILARAAMPTYLDLVDDICWSSEGIVLIKSVGNSGWNAAPRADKQKLPWHPMMASKHTSSILVTLDPETLNPKNGWNIARAHQLAGNMDNDLIFAISNESYASVINVKTGQLLNVHRDVYEMQRPCLSQDGKWLFASKTLDGSSLNRFRVDGDRIDVDSKKNFDLQNNFFSLTPDGKFVTIRDAKQFLTVHSDDFDKVFFQTPGATEGRFVIDSITKTGFLCGRDKPGDPLTLQIFQDERNLRLKLEDGKKSASNLPNGTFIPDSMKAQVPFAMSVAPNGRGVIAFTQDHVYWIEMLRSGKNLAFKNDGVEQVTMVASNGGVATRNVRTDLQPPIPNAFKMKMVAEKVTGNAFELLAGQTLQRVVADPDSGDLALVSRDRKGEQIIVSVVPNSALEQQNYGAPWSLPFASGAPVSICYKQFRHRSYLVVTRDDMLWIIDPKTLLLAEVSSGLQNQIDFRSPKYARWSRTSSLNPPKTELLTSSEDAPYLLYGVGLESSDPKNVNYFKIDLTTGDIVGTETEPPFGWESSAGFAYHRLFPSDPYDKMQTIKGFVLSGGVSKENDLLHMKETISKYNGLLYMKERPFLVARSQTTLQMQNRYHAATFIDVKLPNALCDSRGNEDMSFHTFVYDDYRRDRLIVSASITDGKGHDQPSLLWVLSFEDTGIPDSPMLAARFRTPTYLEPDKSNFIAVELADPRTHLTMVNGPEGSKLQDGGIVWVPSQNDVGQHSFVLEIGDGKSSVTKTLRCDVGYAMADLPFEVIDFHLSSDGTKALVWATHAIAVVDVKTREVIAKRETIASLRKAIIAGGSAYLLYIGDNCLEKCSLSDLSPESIIHLTESIDDLEIVQDRFLFLLNGRDKQSRVGACGKFYAIELPEMTQTKITKIFDGSPGSDYVVQADDGDWVLGPVVLDKELKAVTTTFSLDWTGIHSLVFRPTASPGVGLSNQLSKNLNREQPIASLANGKLLLKPKVKSGYDQARGSLRVEVQLEISDLLNKQITTRKITEFEGASSHSKIRVSRNGMALIASGKFFSCMLTDLGIALPTVPDETPLTIRPQHRLTVLAPVRPTVLKFQILGGKAPYHLQFQVNDAIFGARQNDKELKKKLFQTDNEKSTLSIDGSSLLELILSTKGPLDASLVDFAKNTPPDATVKELVDVYLDKVSQNLKTLSPQTINGFPMSLPITITVKDSNSTEVALSHELLVVLPREQIQSRIHITEKRPLLPASRSNGIPKPELPIIWDGTQIDVSNHLRKLWPTKEDARAIKLKTQAVIYSIQSNSEYIGLSGNNGAKNRNAVQNPMPIEREWILQKDRKVSGAVVGANLVAIHLQRNRPDPFGLGQRSESEMLRITDFTEESLQTIWTDLNQLPRDTARDLTRKHKLGEAIDAFRDDFGCLPNQSIVDMSGKPLLSWRVTLLPYLGYGNLFRLFHLDEPWDSQHNQQLIPYMPLFYNPSQPGHELGKSTVKAIAGPDTAFPLSGLRRLKDLKKTAESILLFVEVKKEFFIVWTKPEDIQESEEQGWREQLYSFRTADKLWFNGWFGDGFQRILPMDDLSIENHR